MSALAIRVAHAAAHVAASGPAAPSAAAPDSGFAALLGKMNHPQPSPGSSPGEDAAKTKNGEPPPDSGAVADATAPTMTALQSLEAALSGLSALAPPPANAPAIRTPGKLGAVLAEPASVGARQAAPSVAPRTPSDPPGLSAKSTKVAGAIDGAGAIAAWDGNAGTPLKALLQADPSLGLQDFQMKTHLAAAGATPTRAGATPLAAETAWRPLSPAAAANTPVAAFSPPSGPASNTAIGAPALPSLPATMAGADAAALAIIAPPRAYAAANAPSPRTANPAPAAMTGSTVRSTHAAAPPPIAFAGASPAVAPSAASADAGARKDQGARDPAVAAGATAAAAAPTTDAAGALTINVPFAQLPVFIAEQASTLAADSAAATPTATTAAQAKAAQAVKELNIALDPADLGQMTLKLRLAGGKLSVTIDVANPQTLAAIEGDRSLIAARILGGDQTLEDLVIQRQSPTSSTPETASAHASANDSDASSSDPDAGSQTPNRSPGAPPRRGGGGAFSDFVV